MIGWRNTQESTKWHIIPMDDDKEHQVSLECWCCPELDEEDNLIIHNSADGRELFERGERKPS